jgi:hypothetical protein
MEPHTCPRCGEGIPNNRDRGLYPGALSRTDNETEICSDCGLEEALNDWKRRLSNRNERFWEVRLSSPNRATYTVAEFADYVDDEVDEIWATIEEGRIRCVRMFGPKRISHAVAHQYDDRLPAVVECELADPKFWYSREEVADILGTAPGFVDLTFRDRCGTVSLSASLAFQSDDDPFEIPLHEVYRVLGMPKMAAKAREAVRRYLADEAAARRSTE